jgi:hypothetical protein
LTALTCAAVLLAATFAAMPAQSVPVPQVACTPIIFVSGQEVSLNGELTAVALSLPGQVERILDDFRLTALSGPEPSAEASTPPVATGSVCGISGAVNGFCTLTGCRVMAEDACVEDGGNWDITVDENVPGSVKGTMTCGTNTKDENADGRPDNEVVWCSSVGAAGTNAGHCEELGLPGDGEGRCGADADAKDGDVVVECADPYGQGKLISIVMHFA